MPVDRLFRLFPLNDRDAWRRFDREPTDLVARYDDFLEFSNYPLPPLTIFFNFLRQE